MNRHPVGVKWHGVLEVAAANLGAVTWPVVRDDPPSRHRVELGGQQRPLQLQGDVARLREQWSTRNPRCSPRISSLEVERQSVRHGLPRLQQSQLAVASRELAAVGTVRGRLDAERVGAGLELLPQHQVRQRVAGPAET
jgi:hypothetical protein